MSEIGPTGLDGSLGTFEAPNADQTRMPRIGDISGAGGPRMPRIDDNQAPRMLRIDDVHFLKGSLIDVIA